VSTKSSVVLILLPPVTEIHSTMGLRDNVGYNLIKDIQINFLQPKKVPSSIIEK